MSDTSDIVEITAPIELAIVDDRLHFTCISGKRQRTYAISFHKALGASMETAALLKRAQRDRGTVHQFPKRGV